MRRRQKYYDVRVKDPVTQISNKFDSCKMAAEWLVEHEYSKSISAARVGMSVVLTGKRPTYRSFTIKARRFY